MFSWIAHQVNNFTGPKEEGPFSELKESLRRLFEFEPVLSSSLELQYKFSLEQICRSTFETDERMVVMDFLHYSVAPVNPNSEWRTIFNGLRLLNALVDSGSSKIFSEVSEGQHFDLLQKTLFLTTYSNSDERIAKLIRTAAQEIREKLLVRFNQIDEQPEEPPILHAGKSISSRDAPLEFQAKKSLDHIASFKHSEEESSSEGENDAPEQQSQLVDLL